MAKYTKFWVAVVGAALIGLDQFLGISLNMNAEGIVTTGIALLSSFGVFGLANKE